MLTQCLFMFKSFIMCPARLTLALLLMMTAPAHAITLETPLENAQQEARAQALFHEIRCMVCAGESIADSRAKLATDLRHYIRENITEGKSDDDIIALLSNAYGDEILMRPPVQKNTIALWSLPFLLLLVGGLGIWRFTRR